MSGNDTIRVEKLDEGQIWRVWLATPKANILDMDKVERLDVIFAQAASETALKAILIEGEGDHFSFGASVEEHLPGKFELMLPGFHRLFERMFDAEIVTLAAVRGRCLGGGLELVSLCNRIFASPGALLGQPEIMLGVFAPVASVALAERIGRSRAEDLCLSGRTIDAAEALRIGLVDDVKNDPAIAALAYAREYLIPRSASSLRLAQRALRGAYRIRFREELKTVERLYMETLMNTKDAYEGLQSFMEKRKPEWKNA
jgi:cyclohexa-1,5-dienecarbonyl-CoA hydratase